MKNNDQEIMECNLCQGEGKVFSDVEDYGSVLIRCPKCDGEGEIHKE